MSKKLNFNFVNVKFLQTFEMEQFMENWLWHQQKTYFQVPNKESSCNLWHLRVMYDTEG